MEKDQLINKIKKIQELIDRGVDGEKIAAEKAMERLKERLGIDNINSLVREEFFFTYSNQSEKVLFGYIIKHYLSGNIPIYQVPRKQQIYIVVERIDGLLIDQAYGYYRGHMKSQYEKEVKKRLKVYGANAKPRTIQKIRKELNIQFVSKYIIASNLHEESDIVKTKSTKYGIGDVEGGVFNKQVSNGLFLE